MPDKIEVLSKPRVLGVSAILTVILFVAVDTAVQWYATETAKAYDKGYNEGYEYGRKVGYESGSDEQKSICTQILQSATEQIRKANQARQKEQKLEMEGLQRIRDMIRSMPKKGELP